MKRRNNRYLDFLASFGIGGAHPGGLPLTMEILKREKLDQASKVLDVGCGTGLSSAYVAKLLNCEVTGLDNHPMMIQKAKERFDGNQLNVEIVKGNAEQLPFPDCSYDFVLVESVSVFTSSILKSIREYERVLKPKGVLIEIEMTAEPSLTDDEISIVKKAYELNEVLTEDEWRSILQEVGFDSIEVITGGTVYPMLKYMSESQFPSPNREHFMTWKRHQEVMGQYANKLGYRVYRAIKRH